ncbi:VOC family protein [Ferrimonas futtsuensis]|uniref:VOC family protein n=1 Tax=Ferrimonas futtsuensis TaxID=364764 RepID=UPI00040F71C6|nr:VOC family protein [Ferrimonas futtsuensis]
MKIAEHRLRVSNLKRSMTFYHNLLGMELVSLESDGGGQCVTLSYGPEQASLVLLEDKVPLAVAIQPNPAEGYWKFSLAVDSVPGAVRALRRMGVATGDPFEVPQVATLCHFTDPDGYCIELVQRTLGAGDQLQGEPGFERFAPSMLLSTVRIKEPGLSLAFYQQAMGMRLLSRQPVPERNMTLYFLGYDDAALPEPELEAVANREWLWQRPYTLLELQHIQGTESLPGFRYHNGPERGFVGLGVTGLAPKELKSELAQWGVRWESGDRWTDPDGFAWSLMS